MCGFADIRVQSGTYETMKWITLYVYFAGRAKHLFGFKVALYFIELNPVVATYSTEKGSAYSKNVWLY